MDTSRLRSFPGRRRSTAGASVPRALKNKEVRGFYKEVVETFALEPYHLTILYEACAALEKSRAAAAIVEAEGMVYEDKSGRKYTHPAVATELNCRAQFLKGLRELGLDIEATGPALLPARQGSRKR